MDLTVINCSECGVLFIKKNSSLCPKCDFKQKKTLNDIIRFVSHSTEPVRMAVLLERFDITLDQFERLFVARKFLKIADKLIIKCNSCQKEISALNRNNFLCGKCSGKIFDHCEKLKDDVLNAD